MAGARADCEGAGVSRLFRWMIEHRHKRLRSWWSAAHRAGAGSGTDHAALRSRTGRGRPDRRPRCRCRARRRRAGRGSGALGDVTGDRGRRRVRRPLRRVPEAVRRRHVRHQRQAGARDGDRHHVDPARRRARPGRPPAVDRRPARLRRVRAGRRVGDDHRPAGLHRRCDLRLPGVGARRDRDVRPAVAARHPARRGPRPRCGSRRRPRARPRCARPSSTVAGSWPASPAWW